MTDSQRKYFAIVPGAGVGKRFEGDSPKQFQTIKNRTIIEHSLSALLDHPKIESVIVVLSQPNPFWENLPIASHPKIIIAEGGSERMNSVQNGLRALASLTKTDDWVLVHDAARPCLTERLITLLIDALDGHLVGGLLAVPVRDTLKRADESGRVIETVKRDQLFQAQTPQMFRYQLLVDALSSVAQSGQLVSDEAQALELIGHHPKLVLSSHRNIKITYPEDVRLVENWLDNEE